MKQIPFDVAFRDLTGNSPFPWLKALYARFERADIPAACNIPTGLGKTSVIAVWLIALANFPTKMPRRLVYVVNRRTVVDQTTDEVEKLRDQLLGNFGPPPKVLWDLRTELEKLCALPAGGPLSISTLRGQFADNREWSADPARPAVICGTVDMIGSRLLFSGYRVGFKGKPLHAGFLGQDVLLVHDEAHLEPAFQELLENIQLEQRERERVGELPWRKLQVMALTATARNQNGATSDKTFELTHAEKTPAAQVPDPPAEPLHVAWRRLKARKAVHFIPVDDEKKELADKIAGLALEKFKSSGKAILVFVRTVENVDTIVAKLNKEKQQVQQLTGTMRGLERDDLPKDRIFARFLPPSNRPEGVTPAEGTVYLVCTSAGEVGVNISADHLVCDLTTFDSMAQRFGRVNRFGDRTDTEIHIVHPKKFDESDEYERRRKKTLELLQQLDGDGSPAVLGKLDAKARQDAFAPTPTIPPVTDMLFDSWALTTIHEKLPGRPPVDPYLHGLADEKQFDTAFAWREEVAILARPKGASNEERQERAKEIEEYLDEYPIKPHEVLTERTYRALDNLKALAKSVGDQPAWRIDGEGALILTTVSDLATTGFVPLVGSTVVLPPHAGGLSANGTLAGKQRHSVEVRYDVADAFPGRAERPRLRFLWTAAAEDLWKLLGTGPDFAKQPDARGRLPGMKRLPPVRLDGGDDEPTKQLFAFVGAQMSDGDETRSRQAREDQLLDEHLAAVERCASLIADRLLPRDESLRTALVLAGKWHDLGKNRVVWQRSIGNCPSNPPLAKSKNNMRFKELEGYRHEFGSLLDVLDDKQSFRTVLDQQPEEVRELVLHLIAVHHGFGRPHFPAEKAFDQEHAEGLWKQLAAEVPQRFARLQRKYGRWGLAYLESLLRAADYAASAKPSKSEGDGRCQTASSPMMSLAGLMNKSEPTRINVDPTNPGQFFACCGLLELADRLWPGAEGWFENGQFLVASDGTLQELLAILVMDAPQELTTLDNGLSAKPLIAPLRFSFDGAATQALTLDAWMTIRLEKGEAVAAANPPWNFWSGQQTSLRIWLALRAALAEQLQALNPDQFVSLFSNRVLLSGRFGFDPGAAWNALDVGFSPNEQGIEVESSAAVELLAAVGIQRFRPSMAADSQSFVYATWGQRLAPSVAAAVSSGAIEVPPTQRFRGRVVSRGSYAALGHSTPIRGESNE